MERARVALAASTHCPELAFDCLYNGLLHRCDLATFALFAFALALSAFALAFLSLAFVVLAFVAFVLAI